MTPHFSCRVRMKAVSACLMTYTLYTIPYDKSSDKLSTIQCSSEHISRLGYYPNGSAIGRSSPGSMTPVENGKLGLPA